MAQYTDVNDEISVDQRFVDAVCTGSRVVEGSAAASDVIRTLKESARLY
jgi:hypothetical protein